MMIVPQSNMTSGLGPYIYHYRDKVAKEIGVILEHDGILNSIEINKSSNPGSELTRFLRVG